MSESRYQLQLFDNHRVGIDLDQGVSNTRDLLALPPAGNPRYEIVYWCFWRIAEFCLGYYVLEVREWL